MIHLTSKTLKAAAVVYLDNAPGDPKAIVRLHTAVYLAIGLVLALVTLAANAMIENTGGLADMTTRTVISTAEMLITLAAQAFTPLWTVGFTCCALGFARQQRVEKRHLLGGVQRWPVLLRLYLCQGAVCFIAAYALLMVLMPVYLVTPWGMDLFETVEGAMGTAMTIDITPELQQAMLKQMAPLYAVWLPALGAILVFLRYLFGLALYRVLDADRPGAIRAMLQSCRMLRWHRRRLFRLDLSYWWYYLAQGVLSCILWVPDILAALEVALPVSGDVAYLLCYIVYALGTAALYLGCLARVETAYAMFYDSLLPKKADTPAQ